MIDFHSASMHRARKHHTCDHCGRSIPPGQTYQRAFIKDGGDVWTWVSHADCAALANEIWNASDCRDDEGICLLDEWANYRDEMESWRGHFPHVICRLEYRAIARAALKGDSNE